MGVGDQNTFKYDERISLSTEYKYLEQLQARKLKYKLEDVRRRGRKEEGGHGNEQLVSRPQICHGYHGLYLWGKFCHV